MKDLSKCEQMVMEEIWNAGKIDMAGIKEKIDKRGTSWEKQTVSTFLHRIVKKGYAKGEKRGRYTYYRPDIDKNDYAEKLKREYEEFCKAAGVEVEGGKL